MGKYKAVFMSVLWLLSFQLGATDIIDYSPLELLIKIRPGYEITSIQHPALNLQNATTIGPSIGLYRVAVAPTQNLDTLATQISQLTSVHYAEPNYYYQAVVPIESGKMVQHWQHKTGKNKFYRRHFMLDLRLLLGSQFLPTNVGDIHGVFILGNSQSNAQNTEDIRLIQCPLEAKITLATADILHCMRYFHSLQISGMKLLATLNPYSVSHASNALLDAIRYYDLMDIQFISVALGDIANTYPQKFDVPNILTVTYVGSNRVPTTPFYFDNPNDEILEYNLHTTSDSDEPLHIARYYRNEFGTRLIIASQPSPMRIKQTSSNQSPVELEMHTPLSGVLGLDADHDGMADGWEIENHLDPHNPEDAQWDMDFDSLTNVSEYRLGTDIYSADTDGDHHSDSDEIYIHNTNPLQASGRETDAPESVRYKVFNARVRFADTDDDEPLPTLSPNNRDPNH